MKLNQDELNILRKLQINPKDSQRKLANDLGFSLGKLNYCLSALKSKGLIKVKNFSQHKNKLGYVYLLTPAGIAEKTKLTVNFMKIKMKEYDELAKELKEIRKNRKK
ncbi:MAG: MarR family EPS-associated transcriptional regulator [Cytophagia bacterium]|nr:MarR family EPS-associated transcriptional regulator [Cytophagia bacterium]|tara:strand:- start:1723 stop:2043 length:321 start_codon:yes stop_codon:yes gene_type:complete